MIIVTKPGITNAEIDHIRERIESLGLRTHISRGEHRTIVGCIGDEDRLREVPILALPGVEQVLPLELVALLLRGDVDSGPRLEEPVGLVALAVDERGEQVRAR